MIERLLFYAAFYQFYNFSDYLCFIFGNFGIFKEVSLFSFLTIRSGRRFLQINILAFCLLCGTVLTTTIAIAVAVPIGLISAVYLSEYASEKMRNIIKPCMEILAAVPTVVYGYFALLFVTPLLKKIIPQLAGFNALSAGFVMGIMIIPLVSSLSEDAMHAVPIGLREGAYALGSHKIQVAFRIVFPAALSGITAAVILAVSRAIGETMIVAIAAGQQARLTLNPLVPIETITAYIVQISLGDTPGTINIKRFLPAARFLFV